MGPDASPRSGALFRGAVIVACAALVLGVAGIFYFQAQERARRSLRPLDEAVVLIAAPGDGGALEVEAHWRAPGGADHTEVGRRGAEPGTWFFREAPEARPLTLKVFRRSADGRREIGRQPGILTRGAVFEVRLRGGAR